MNIDWVALSGAIPYAGIAIIFGLFVLEMQKRQDRKDQARDAAEKDRETARENSRRADQKRQDEKDAARDARFLESLAARDTEWRNYMGKERERQAEGMTTLARELERLSTVGQLTNSLIKEHDTWERAIHEAARARRSGDTGPLGKGAG